MSYIQFREATYTRPRKTKTWEIINTNTGVPIGNVGWYGPFRKYAFFPHQETIYDGTCLREIASFIEERMHEHRSKEQPQGERGSNQRSAAA